MSQSSPVSAAQPIPPMLEQASVKAADSPAKIKDAAQQFEGLLIAQILSTAHEDGGWLGAGSDSSSGAATSFAEQQLAGLIARNGGLGLASIISAGLENRQAAETAASSPGPGATPPSLPSNSRR
jgi:Rod binding domain-containing protein